MRSQALLLLVVACGGSLPRPGQSASPEDTFMEVPYPPPAALSELVPPPPPNRAGVVFLDGGWTWRGGYYVWQRGGWVAPRAGLRFAPWSLRYLPDGRTLFADGHWVDETGRTVRPPAIIVPTMTPPNEVTAEFQTGR
jgi:hypothetical protein